MKILSKEFKHGEYIPEKFTCEGQNINPELVFQNIPEDAKSLVLIFDDPDVPAGLREDRNFDHWILFNILPETMSIKENDFVGIRGINTRGDLDYVGPCPPDTIHRYFFRLYALSETLDLPEGVDKQTLYKSMEGKILQKAFLVGLYEKKFENKSIDLV